MKHVMLVEALFHLYYAYANHLRDRNVHLNGITAHHLNHKDYHRHITSSSPLLLDRDRFKQIIVNLISNSIRYTETGGKIHIHIIYAIETFT
jgi:signal transduction histidine kinase